MDEMDKWLTTLDTARVLEKSVEQVRAYERSGRLPAQRTRGGQRIFRAVDVEQFAKHLRKD